MDKPTRKPLWKRKRWYLFGILWLVLTYIGGVAPVGYALGRGWISLPFAELYVTPLEAIDDVPGFRSVSGALREYAQWWLSLGEEHAS